MRLEDRAGEPLPEATVTVDEVELMDLLEGIADVVEGTRDHLHFAQVGGPQLVVRRGTDGDADPIERQADWWLGPLVLFGLVFIVIGAATVIRWAAALL